MLQLLLSSLEQPTPNLTHLLLHYAFEMPREAAGVISRMPQLQSLQLYAGDLSEAVMGSVLGLAQLSELCLGTFHPPAAGHVVQAPRGSPAGQPLLLQLTRLGQLRHLSIKNRGARYPSEDEEIYFAQDYAPATALGLPRAAVLPV